MTDAAGRTTHHAPALQGGAGDNQEVGFNLGSRIFARASQGKQG